MNHFVFTLGLPKVSELYRFDEARSKLGDNRAVLFLTQPLVPVVQNPILCAGQGGQFAKLIIRQYDQGGTLLLKQTEYRDVVITRLDTNAPDLILEFTFKP